jgi:hypothetical protein
MLGSRRLIIQRAVTRLTRSGSSRPELRLLEAAHPRLPDRRGVYLEDAADNEAISDYVEVVFVPLARWARS